MTFKYLNELLLMILRDQITNIFVQIDDFCKEFDAQIKQMKLGVLCGPKKRRNRASLMSDLKLSPS